MRTHVQTSPYISSLNWSAEDSIRAKRILDQPWLKASNQRTFKLLPYGFLTLLSTIGTNLMPYLPRLLPSYPVFIIIHRLSLKYRSALTIQSSPLNIGILSFRPPK